MTEPVIQPQTPTAGVEAPSPEKTELGRLLDKGMLLSEEGGIEIKNLEDLKRLAQYIVDSGLAPKGDTVSGVVVKIQAGLEMGFSPMRSLAVLTAINGRLGIMGDAAKALIRARGALKPGTNFVTTFDGDGDKLTATVTAWRKGTDAPTSRAFSIADAKLARLIATDTDKHSPWLKYPRRMLGYRALGFLVRDDYSDVLLGFRLVEELRDTPLPRAAEIQGAPDVPSMEPDPVLTMGGR